MLLPMPGSPPISTIEPGTIPPPSTRSNSPIPDAMRGASLASITSQGLGRDAAAPASCGSGRPLPGAGWASCRSSAKLFHSPQSGQRPSHFELSKPQAWQAKKTLAFVRRPLRATRGSRSA